MAMSDCPKCWETPCACGWKYKDYKDTHMIDFLFNVLKYHDKEYIKNVIGELSEIYEINKGDSK